MEASSNGIAASNPAAIAEETHSFAELADRISKRVATAVVIAGAIVGMAIYWRPVPNHFEAFVAGGEVFRVNAKTGTVIACNGVRCMTVVQRGRRLMGSREGKLFQGRDAAASMPPRQERRLPPPA